MSVLITTKKHFVDLYRTLYEPEYGAFKGFLT